LFLNVDISEVTGEELLYILKLPPTKKLRAILNVVEGQYDGIDSE